MTTVESSPLPRFAYEIAHQVREALLDVGVRKRAKKIARDAIEKQWELLEAGRISRLAAMEKHRDWRAAGFNGDPPPLPGPNLAASLEFENWPFPVQHGVEQAPGCVLVLAAINDYAEEHAGIFRKLDCEFAPLVAFKPGGPWAIYARWVHAVGKLTVEHEIRLGAVIDAALRQLGVNGSEKSERTADNSSDKKKKHRKFPSDSKVLRLAKKINEQYDPDDLDKTKKTIAEEYTRGDKKEAKRLLKQLQPSRYGSLLDPPADK